MRRAGGYAAWLLVLGVGVSAAWAASDGSLIAVGERLYREGLLASGAPARGLVAGDVPLTGAQAACVSCHRRSGLGSSEGGLVASPLTQSALYRDLTGRRRNRPAYTDETLAQAIREGVDPAGQPLDRSMPRFDLPAPEMAALIAYLQTLSADVSPGVTADAIHFATVTTPGVDASAMLAVLTAYVEQKNRETRHEGRRVRVTPVYLEKVKRAYRKWILHSWTLEGTPDTWDRQLETYYRAQPVFTMVSGMVSGSWEPIHRFCERHRIPCLLPNTDLPVVGEAGYYTLYFSQGVTLEAKAIAAHLLEGRAAGRVLQIFRDGAAGEAATRALRAALAPRADLPVAAVALRGQPRHAAEAIGQALAANPGATVVAWLGPEDVAVLDIALARAPTVPVVYLSSTLLGGPGATAPALSRPAFLAHPFSLPSEFRQRFQRAAPWLRQRGIAITDERILAQTYFACRVLAEGVMHLTGDDVYRDYLVEFVDHLDATSRFSIAYPSPSFGPGQRYISKGCYIVEFPRGNQARAQSPVWIVP
jgi:mono/diheme cytochrome c family protein